MSSFTSAAADDSSPRAPVTPEQLKRFLIEAPAVYKYRLHKGAERQILTNCYRSLWGNNVEFMQKYFFKEGLSDSDNLSALLEKYNLFGSTDETTVSSSSSVVLPSNPDNVLVGPTGDEPEYWENQRGKQCGHLFKKGESVYRCRNCGLDDTCVLCSRCFHATNHDGHDVKIWISRGAGGCCDCGDPEAWKVPLECSIHSLSAAPAAGASGLSASSKDQDAKAALEPRSQLSPVLLRQIKETVEVVMDYILETFAASPEDVSPGTKESILQDWKDSSKALNMPDSDKDQMFACILWNDEKHSFDEVINIVMRATSCSKAEATRVAESVDAHGRHVVETSTNLQDLLAIAERIHSIKLAVTVRSCKDTVREDICGLLLNWLKDLISGRYKFFSNVEGGNCILRDIICEVLCAEWSLRPELAALSTRSRRGPMSEADYEVEELDMDGSEDEQEDQDEQVNEDDMMAARMLLDGGEFVVTAFEPAEEEDWMFPEDDTFQEEGEQDEGEYEDEDEDEDEEDEDEDNEDESYHESDSDVEMSQPAETTNEERPQEPPETAPVQPPRAQPTQRRHSHHRLPDIIDLTGDLDSWLSYTETLEAEEHEIAKKLGAPVPSTPKTFLENKQKIKKEFHRKLRLDYLMLFDLRLWKTARASIKDLLIGTVVSNFNYRPVIGVRFARNYPQLVDAFFLKDREPEHSISTLSVQLLTVPTVAALLVKEYKFFGIVCSILANFFLTDRIQLLLPEEYRNMQVDCGSRAIRRHRFAYTFFDLRYVLNAEPVKLAVCQSPLYLRQFLDMLYQFQAMDPLERRADVHVEFESNTWVSAFNVTLQVSKLCRLFSDCFASLYSNVPPLEASRCLCRSISRVIKALVEWSPRRADQTDVNEQLPIIKGIREQRYKTIDTLHAGSFSVISYDIAKEPVSFHHPYHWLLAEFLEHVRLLSDDVLSQLGWANGLKDIIGQFNNDSGHDTFLAILEYPLRMRALVAQINCGVWVRNGFGIRNQARTYRDVSVRENTYDRDIYLIQAGFVLTNPDHLLVTMLDRFDLLEWFNGKPEKAHPYYDSSQMRSVVEEFLDFLIIIVTERAYATNMPLDEKIRRAIIQYLGLSSMAYSELVKVVPDSLSEHESFESQLGKLAIYKAPGGLNDHGRYELKDEYYDEIDPYFWHFTRNQREEAIEKLRSRQHAGSPGAKKDGMEKGEFFMIPKLRKIEQGPFKHLGNCLHSKVMCQIILHALWNTRISEPAMSASILDDALYLAMLAVTDENNETYEKKDEVSGFYAHAVNDKYPITVNGLEREHVSLLTVLLRFLGEKEYKHVHKRCGYIVDKIEKRGSAEAKRIIGEWRATQEQLQLGKAHEEANNEPSEYERKKAAAKARQADIMAQFAKAQSQFMSQHAELYEDEEETSSAMAAEDMDISGEETGEDADVERTCHFPAGTCIVCQEELDRSQVYGMLGLVQKSKTMRSAPLKNAAVLYDVLETAQGRDTWAEHMEAAPDKTPAFRGFPFDAHVEGLHISTCGHLMHAHCFNGYQQTVDNEAQNALRSLLPLLSRRQFLCPLCKALGNVLLPIVWKGKKESFPGPVAVHTPYETIAEASKQIMGRLDNEINVADSVPGSMRETPEQVNDPSGRSNAEIADIDQLRSLYVQLCSAMDGNLDFPFHELTIRRPHFRKSVSNLYDMYAYVISAIETAHRGDHGIKARDMSVEHTGTFLDDISAQNQTLLKILAMTAELMPSVMNTRWITDEGYVVQRIGLSTLERVFSTGDTAERSDDRISFERTPLLRSDIFQILTRLGFAVTRTLREGLEIHHLMRLLFVAELTKTTIGLLQGLRDGQVLNDARVAGSLQRLANAKITTDNETEAARQFACNIASLVQMSASSVQDFFNQIPPSVFAALLRTFTLPYLRRCLLLMVVHHGYIPQNPQEEAGGSSQSDNNSEYDRLLHFLHLPTFSEVLELQPFEQGMVTSWCRHYNNWVTATTGRQSPSDNGAAPSTSSSGPRTPSSPLARSPQVEIMLTLPSPFYLVSLPYRMDQLFDESLRRVCRKCGTLPESPALCLICGTFVCARRYCCTENERGECNLHMRSCSGDIGIYLVVKESFVLLLHNDGGTIMSAPYLDTHGEVDLFLRRGTPQYLNPQRYEQIRQMWLSHSVPAYVRRKMEASFSYTRWESW